MDTFFNSWAIASLLQEKKNSLTVYTCLDFMLELAVSKEKFTSSMGVWV